MTDPNGGEQYGRMRQELDDIKARYVSRDEFWPVRLVVYGMIGTIALTALVAILNLLDAGSQL